MDILNIIGATAFCLTVVALWLLGKPSRMNFVVFIGSYLLQIYIFYATKQWFLILQMLVLAGFSVLNYMRWTKQGVGMKENNR